MKNCTVDSKLFLIHNHENPMRARGGPRKIRSEKIMFSLFLLLPQYNRR